MCIALLNRLRSGKKSKQERKVRGKKGRILSGKIDGRNSGRTMRISELKFERRHSEGG